MYKVKKVDKRHVGTGHFKYFVSSNSHLKIRVYYDFFTLREWCWTTFGPSKEIHIWLEDYKYPLDQALILHHNPNWAWKEDDYNKRIYLKDDKALTLFNLRFL